MLVAKLLIGVMAIFTVATTTPTVDPPVPVNPCSISVEECVGKYFPEEPKLAVAVFKAESRLNPRSIGYNCRYERFDKEENATTTYVTTCKPSDRELAISKDYGLAQINQANYHGNKEDLLDVETNLKVARKVYDEQTWNAWYVYRDKKYVQYLE